MNLSWFMTPELQLACEAIFQEHKAKNNSISWRKDAFRGRISTGMLDLAKETLLDKHIIYYPNPSKKIITKLNPEIMAAHSFAEAEVLVLNRIPVLASLGNHDISTTLVSEKGDLILSDKPRPSHIVNTPPDDYQAIHPKTKWYQSNLFIYLVWPLCAAALFWFIAWLINTVFTDLFFDLK